MAEIGKNVIENLTSAMYENSFTVFREYIQNSADSIDKAISLGIVEPDEAFIDITIEPGKRRVSIYDNACGIPAESFIKILSDIADSTKDKSKDKGFRGIGRLAGVAYCKKLVFRSSSIGENVLSQMTWDGNLLREILNDNSQHPSASDLVDKIIECKTSNAEVDDHFFEVVMEDIIPESDNLINEHDVITYLQAVAPVPYINSFVYRTKIYSFAEDNNFKIDEYNITLNGNQIYKPYKTTLYEGTSDNKTPFDEIKDVEFKTFKSSSGELLAWMWFGISRYEKQIPVINEMRGIRLRKGNIQIGNEETLSYPKFFKEPRGGYYFIGEVFALSTELIPNARRDYFNTNATLKEFEDKLYPLFYNDFYKLYHYANKVKTSVKKIASYEQKKQEFSQKQSQAGFISKEDEEQARRDLEASREQAKKAQHELDLREKDTESNSVLNRVYTEINNEYEPKIENTQSDRKEGKSDTKKDKKYITQTLSKYTKKEQKLIGSIYEIIKRILPNDTAELVIQKIQEELKK